MLSIPLLTPNVPLSLPCGGSPSSVTERAPPATSFAPDSFFICTINMSSSTKQTRFLFAFVVFVLSMVLLTFLTSLLLLSSPPLDTPLHGPFSLIPQHLMSRFGLDASSSSQFPSTTRSYDPRDAMSLTIRGGQITCDDGDPVSSSLASSLFGYFRSQSPSSFSSELSSSLLSRLASPLPLLDASGTSSSSSSEEQFLSFEPDSGGWNNIRISLENVVLLAVVTGRTLVLPPPQLFYLLDDSSKLQGGRTDPGLRKSFGDFFPLFDVYGEAAKTQGGDGGGSSSGMAAAAEQAAAKVSGGIPGVLKVLTMSEYISRYEGSFVVPLSGFKSSDNAALGYDGASVSVASLSCVDHKALGVKCEVLSEYLRVSASAVAPWNSAKDCLVFRAKEGGGGGGRSPTADEEVKHFCGDRHEVAYDDDLRHARFLHLPSSRQENRLLSHFYSFLYFEDPFVDRFAKRFIRDFLHYKDDIFCKAATIVEELKKEARSRGSKNGAFSTFHIRRGDFQYKEVKISAKEMLDNVADVLGPNELIYISTDERDATFFKPFLDAGHTVRFLSDYGEVADLKAMDTNYFGMLDTAVAAHGRVFVGTWFSTFTGYINRLRGYLGKDDRSSWFSYLPRKGRFQNWEEPIKGYYQREWPTGWRGIDEQGYGELNSFSGTKCSGYNFEKATDREDPFVDLGRCNPYG